MNRTLLLASIGLLAAVASHSSLAHARGSTADERSDSLQAPVTAPDALRTSASGRRDEHADRHDRSDHRADGRHASHARHGDASHVVGMQAVPTAAGPGEQGHGWSYFSDPAARRAVVISPRGEYFFSHGHGLRPLGIA